MKIVGIIQVANSFIILAWAYELYYYAKIMGEFMCAILCFFARESYVFRWLVMIIQSILFHIGMMIMQVIFMVWVIDDFYCYINDLCDYGISEYVMYTMYAQFAIAFTLEAIAIILTTNMMMSLGWFYTEQFPPQMNLEQYGLERPDKKTTIYDMIPHPVNYGF